MVRGPLNWDVADTHVFRKLGVGLHSGLRMNMRSQAPPLLVKLWQDQPAPGSREHLDAAENHSQGRHISWRSLLDLHLADARRSRKTLPEGNGSLGKVLLRPR